MLPHFIPIRWGIPADPVMPPLSKSDAGISFEFLVTLDLIIPDPAL